MRDVTPRLTADDTLLSLKPNSKTLLKLAALAWIIEIIDSLLLGQSLNSLGIRPRSLGGLIGIPLMPLLHGGISHLAANTIPFLILGWIVLKAEKDDFFFLSFAISLLGGLGTWLIAGSGQIHIGASLLVYGYFGYIMVRAWKEKNPIWFLIGLVVAIGFGSMIFGVFPAHLMARPPLWHARRCMVWLPPRSA